jgi:hypothetical protein
MAIRAINKQAPLAHAYNPSYSGGRDQQDCGLRAKSLRVLISKKPITKKGWWSGSRCRPLFQNQFRKKKKALNKEVCLLL